MPACYISYIMKFLFVLVQLGAAVVSKMQNACAALAAVLFTALIENLKLCSSAEAGLFSICS